MLHHDGKRKRGTVSPDDKLYALGLEKAMRRRVNRDKRQKRGKEGEDIIYIYVTPVDEKSHHVRPSFDACSPQMRQLADILWVRRLFDQHFQRDININV